MKLSKLVGDRFKERPAGCLIDSHALMVRGGYIKNVANGIYSQFPPMKRISQKIEAIIRDEMDKIDGQEVLFPVAQEAGLDLVKIAPTAKPPVCKIIDYGKYRYELARKEKEAKKKQKTIEIKEVRLSPNIDTNDLNTKVGAARKFITKGDKVKVTLRFRGREMAHMNSSKYILDEFAESLSDIATVDKAPKVEGRSMTMFLTAKR